MDGMSGPYLFHATFVHFSCRPTPPLPQRNGGPWAALSAAASYAFSLPASLSQLPHPVLATTAVFNGGCLLLSRCLSAHISLVRSDTSDDGYKSHIFLLCARAPYGSIAHDTLICTRLSPDCASLSAVRLACVCNGAVSQFSLVCRWKRSRFMAVCGYLYPAALTAVVRVAHAGRTLRSCTLYVYANGRERMRENGRDIGGER